MGCIRDLKVNRIQNNRVECTCADASTDWAMSFLNYWYSPTRKLRFKGTITVGLPTTGNPQQLPTTGKRAPIPTLKNVLRSIFRYSKYAHKRIKAVI